MADISRLSREVQWYGEEVRANERRLSDAERQQALYTRTKDEAERKLTEAERMIAEGTRKIDELKRKIEADTRSLRRYESELKSAESVAREGRKRAA
ncbi:MAG TPA: hypothetical protein VGE48_00950 [Candidatus Paceibacterota bacterium]